VTASIDSVLPTGASRAGRREPEGGIAARRAVMRWAWRLFRREWRQQILVLGLVVIAVAATFLAAAVATNNPPPANSGFGTAQDLASFQNAGPQTLAQIASIERHYGTGEVIENQTLPVPGSIATFDLRAQASDGPYSRPMLQLVSGHFPSTANQVALSSVLASTLDLTVGDVFREAGISRQIVGIVQNPQSLLDEFALVLPGQVRDPTSVTLLFDAPGVDPAKIGSNVVTPATVGNDNPLNP
jgi:putative ABC transport system permease protein